MREIKRGNRRERKEEEETTSEENKTEERRAGEREKMERIRDWGEIRFFREEDKATK